MIVFFDLDGTLISDDEAYIIPDSAVNAIHKAQENGHCVCRYRQNPVIELLSKE